MLQGERQQASANKSLGRFDLTGIEPAPRGMPQIEVTFSIDANGILNVSAKDKKTGKEQSIVIKANSGLSDEEIQRMVKDAAAHAEEDKKFQEKVGAKNNAEAMIYGVEKALTDLGDKVSAEEKEPVTAAIAELRTALAGDDVADINAKTEALMTASLPLMQKAQESASAAPNEGPVEAEVVDGDFKETDKK